MYTTMNIVPENSIDTRQSLLHLLYTKKNPIVLCVYNGLFVKKHLEQRINNKLKNKFKNDIKLFYFMYLNLNNSVDIMNYYYLKKTFKALPCLLIYNEDSINISEPDCVIELNDDFRVKHLFDKLPKIVSQ